MSCPFFTKKRRFMTSRKIYLLIGTLSLIGFLTLLVSNVKNYKATENYYADSFVEYIKSTNTSQKTKNENKNGITNDENTEATSLLDMKLDYKGLSDKNSDFIGWLRNNEMDLPLVQTTDNDFYLSHNFDKESNKYGCIFLDYRINMDDNILLFHGHNVNGNLMFGSLKKYKNTEGYLEENRKFAIALPNSEYDFIEYNVEQIAIVEETNELLDPSSYSMEEYKKLIKKYVKNPSDKLMDSDKIIVLSTCYGRAGTDKRLLIFLI